MARSSSALLAMCLFAAVALAAAAAPKVAPASNCEDSEPGMPGGWARVDMVPDDVYGAIQLSLVEGGNSTWSQPCDDPVPTLLAACSQVVAGRNYEVVARLSCPDVDSTVAVHAEVYVPLAFSNEEPQVTSLEIISVDDSELAY